MSVARNSNSPTQLRPRAGAWAVGIFWLGGWALAFVSSAEAQDQTFDAVSGGTVQVAGSLSVGGLVFTHTPAGGGAVTGALLSPNLSTMILSGGSPTFNTVTVSGNATSAGDVFVGNLSTAAASLANILFQDNADHVSGSVLFGAVNLTQGGGGLQFGAHGSLTLTDQATGNTLTINPADFTIRLGGLQAGVVSLLGAGAASTSYSSENLTLDFSTASAPFIQLFSAQNSSVLTGNGSAATLGFSQVGGGGLTFSPTGQTVSFSNGLVLNGNSGTAPFGTRSVAIGDNAEAGGSGAVALSQASASGNLAAALGNGSTASGNGALALSGGNASGGHALAAGYNSIATAPGATALGVGVSAQNWGAVVMGYNNSPIAGNATAWAPGDPAFIVGDGAANGAPGNAMVILNNGNVSVGGPVNLTNSAKQLQINGPAILNGQATFTGPVLLPQALGDISMGAYSN